MATAVSSGSSCRASQSIAPLTTVPVEPPNRNPRRAIRWQARMVSASSTSTTSSTYDSSSSGGATLAPSPGIMRGGRTKGHRADAVHGDDAHRPVPLPQEARAAHQGPGGPRPDEQHVQVGELAHDRRRRRAVVRPPVPRVGVLVEPHVPIVGGAPPADVVEPGAEQAALGVRFGGDDVHLAAQGLHQPHGRQVAAEVRHAQEPVALARGDHAQRHAQVPGRGLDQDRLRGRTPSRSAASTISLAAFSLTEPAKLKPSHFRKSECPNVG